MPDRYTYPNSEVLRNKFSLVDQFGLSRVENGLVELGLASLAAAPADPTFTFGHLQAIHRRLFGELYEWAGTFRQTDRAARGTGVVHCRPEFLESAADDVFGALKTEDFLTGLDRDAFAVAVARHWGAMAVLDPFRDGNIRSQAVFLEQLARSAGWSINWGALDPDWVKEARMGAAAGNPGLLGKLLARATGPLP
ncbi:cell filamentation protein [Arthrobacter livingstonensis]|uniref:protein adenylyltransferase n=1 Tax=Arthrobacter livingstonensis TaxID=670078 RepID=A0A2V5L908_9MICC|nr:Fic family protein [Arthrobacter livingstonensis]PYI68161.1 cell filamentation protein [Arthrobacter livingstonensis]